MEILFARHGNTFRPGDRVVWVGRETDLPLVEKGEQQAAAAAEALHRTGRSPEIIFAASLSRTRRFAEIVADRFGGVETVIDPRLDEIDYGRWANRTNDEIAAEGPDAQAAMQAWGDRDVWPSNAGWISRQADIRKAVADFVADRLTPPVTRRVLVVSSNGILRFLPRAVLPTGALDRPSFKMRTGGLGVVERDAAVSRLVCWDVKAEDFI